MDEKDHDPASRARQGSREHPAEKPQGKPGSGPRAGTGFSIGAVRLDAARPEPGLYLVATPIGNLRDITMRALEILAGADVIACEDTRMTRRLLDRYAIKARTLTYNDHSGERERAAILARLDAGQAVALVSDAGTPLVSDPGYRLVREVAEAGHAVVAVPGASSVLAAIGVSGLPSDRFLFAGFLPAKAGERRARIAELGQIPATLVLFESPNRIAAALADLAEGLGPRPAAVARELTKAFETVYRGTLPDLAASFAAEDRVRGEIVVVIGPPEPDAAPAEADIDAMLRRALATMSLKDAAAAVSGATGLKKRDVYNRALALSAKGNK